MCVALIVFRLLFNLARQPYRGFMLDTSRNYFPVDTIKRQLDAMSWVKVHKYYLRRILYTDMHR